VSIYVEKAYSEGQKAGEVEIKALRRDAIKKLQEWGWVEEEEVIDPTWIDVAYTWSRPDSRWIERALNSFDAYNVFPIWRYGRWVFQGIADSIRDGLTTEAALKRGRDRGRKG